MYNHKVTIERITVIILLILGITISLVQFLYNRSLWLDESMLALNIIHKNYFELLKPLDYNQVAPILFLEIEKFFSTLIPNSEYGLRLFPLLIFWASLFFFYKTVKILFDNIYAIIFALSLFVFNVTLIYYSSEVKQYMCDVLVFTAIVYLILKDYKNEQIKLYILGIAGILAIFLSNVATIILSVAGLYLLYQKFCIKKQKNNIIGLIVVFIAWLSVFAVYYYFFIFNHPAKEHMLGFWSQANKFLPLDSLSGVVRFLINAIGSALKIFSDRISLIVIIVILLITGLFGMIREKKTGLIIITCFPVIIHLFLSGLHLYPFALRLILYIAPGLMLICTNGFKYIITLLSPRLKPKNFRLFCFVPIIFLFSFHEFPIKHITSIFEEIKENINYLKENVNGDETIYVNRSIGLTFQYYQDIGFADLKVPVIIQPADEPDYFENELKKIQGKCWLLFPSHDLWHDEEYIINRLDSIGYNKIKEYKTSNASIYLYNFE